MNEVRLFVNSDGSHWQACLYGRAKGAGPRVTCSGQSAAEACDRLKQKLYDEAAERNRILREVKAGPGDPPQ